MRRRELVKLSKIMLPSEYKRVTCISSQTYNTSGNYVDTLYTPNQDTRVCAKMCMTKANSHSTAYGSESPRFSLLKIRADYNDMQKAEFKEILPLGTPFKVDHNKNNIKQINLNNPHKTNKLNQLFQNQTIYLICWHYLQQLQLKHFQIKNH